MAKSPYKVVTARSPKASFCYTSSKGPFVVQQESEYQFFARARSGNIACL